MNDIVNYTTTYYIEHSTIQIAKDFQIKIQLDILGFLASG